MEHSRIRDPPLLCHQCSMKFNSIGQLSMHRERFCVGGYRPRDIPVIINGEHLASEKIRQLREMKESNMRRNAEDYERDRHLLNQSRSSGEFSPHASDRLIGERYGSAVPVDIVQQLLVSNKLRHDPNTYDMRSLEDIYGSHVPADVVRQLLNNQLHLDPKHKPGLNSKVKKLSETYDRKVSDLKQNRKTLQQSLTELDDRISALQKPTGSRKQYSNEVDRLRYEHSEEVHTQAIDELKSQINSLRLQLKNQTPHDHLVSSSQNHPTGVNKRQAFNFSGGSLVAEISALRQYYINTGGRDPAITGQLTDMLCDAEHLDDDRHMPPTITQQPARRYTTERQLGEELYAMESENYRLQRELLLLKQNSPSRYAIPESGRVEGELDRLSRRDHLEKMLALERDMEVAKNQALLDQMKRRIHSQPVDSSGRVPVSRPSPPLSMPSPLPSTQIPPIYTPYYNRLADIPRARYDSVEGFTCFYDFVMGLESSAHSCKLVVGLYSKVAELGEPSLLPTVKTELAETGTVAMIGGRQRIPQCPPSADLGLVVEMQISDSTPDNLRTKCWMKLDLFDHNQKLRAGAWKIGFYYPPIRPDMSTSDILSSPRYGNAELYMRVVNNQDVVAQSQASITPANHIDYQLPPLNYQQLY